MNVNLPSEWKTLLKSEFKKPYFKELDRALTVGYASRTIYPAESQVFSAFSDCSLRETKVVILGQDPYHGPDQAHGLAFSVLDGTPLPPSLRNIYQELQADVGCIRQSGNLDDWAKQGVLLLNTTLTVEAGAAASHAGWGWEHFTDAVISLLNKEKTELIFVLWGKHAQAKQTLIDQSKHHVITSAHPSPLSAHRGFFGSKPFSQINAILEKQNQQPIIWC